MAAPHGGRRDILRSSVLPPEATRRTLGPRPRGIRWICLRRYRSLGDRLGPYRRSRVGRHVGGWPAALRAGTDARERSAASVSADATLRDERVRYRFAQLPRVPSPAQQILE